MQDNFIINKDTQLCMSLSGRPGNYGTRFHNYLYRALNLNYIYKAFTTTDLPAAIGGIRALGIRGCAVSMPYKEAIIPLVDMVDPSAAALGSVNTIVNNKGVLTAYNTDYLAVQYLLEQNGLSKEMPYVLKGSGGMAKAVAGAFHDAGFKAGTIMARNADKGKKLASDYHYDYIKDESTLSYSKAKLLINVTPVGMAGGPESDAFSFSREWIENADVIFDVVALPVETPLIKQAQSLGKKVISGAEVAKIQAIEQFVLYTGIRPDADCMGKAAEFARG